MVKGYFVSSVGEYYVNEKDKKPTPIGAGKEALYETYVFEWAGKRCRIKDCYCGGLPVPAGTWIEIDGVRAATRRRCLANHRRLVDKYLRVKPEPTPAPPGAKEE
jgi:hypothetical protein